MFIVHKYVSDNEITNIYSEIHIQQYFSLHRGGDSLLVDGTGVPREKREERGLLKVMVFNATFNNISVYIVVEISCWWMKPEYPEKRERREAS